jgi:hypothetical protein
MREHPTGFFLRERPTMKHEDMTLAERAALDRLLDHAQGDSHQSRRVADFLLAWWNAGECGAFDLTTAWGVDDAIVDDMVTVFRLAARQFEAVVRAWRPELITD